MARKGVDESKATIISSSPGMKVDFDSVLAGATESQDQIDRWNKMYTAYIPKSPDTIRAVVLEMDANIAKVYKNKTTCLTSLPKRRLVS